MPKKIQVNFDDQALEVLEDLKDATHGTYGEVIRNAIGLYEWARQECEQGRTIGTIENGRAVKEVVLPFTMLKSRKPQKEHHSNYNIATDGAG